MNSTIKNFRLKGFYNERGKKISFNQETRALNENEAKEKIYLFYGSKHKIKRQQITFLELKELKVDEITDPLVQEFANNKDLSIRRS